GIRGVGNAASNSGVDAAAYAEETFDGAVARQEFTVPRVDIASQQMRAVRVRTRQDERRNSHHIPREPRRYQLLDSFHGRNQDLAAQVAALLGRRQLVFIV